MIFEIIGHINNMDRSTIHIYTNTTKYYNIFQIIFET